ncbi:MAG: DNA-binding protein WhiA, partial [Slackia sp.]|nr:DNA-binding protein WhiA [Slackia sp.]
MNRHSMNAHVLKRRNSFIVYMKSGPSILAFLAFTGAHQGALSMESERVRKSVRNDINRKINAEIANQAKSAASAVDQIVSIRKIVESGKVSSLSPGLQEFVYLRLHNPNASLKELGEKASPPLSKSAVYHRVRRLEDIARKL